MTDSLGLVDNVKTGLLQWYYHGKNLVKDTSLEEFVEV